MERMGLHPFGQGVQLYTDTITAFLQRLPVLVEAASPRVEVHPERPDDQRAELEEVIAATETMGTAQPPVQPPAEKTLPAIETAPRMLYSDAVLLGLPRARGRRHAAQPTPRAARPTPAVARPIQQRLDQLQQ